MTTLTFPQTITNGTAYHDMILKALQKSAESLYAQVEELQRIYHEHENGSNDGILGFIADGDEGRRYIAGVLSMTQVQADWIEELVTLFLECETIRFDGPTNQWD